MTCSSTPTDSAGCAPDGHEVAAELAARLSALSHPARIEMLMHLSARPSCCCRDVVERFDLAQSTVSQHLKILVDAGLVRFAPDRQRSRYEVDLDALADMSASLTRLVERCCAGR